MPEQEVHQPSKNGFLLVKFNNGLNGLNGFVGCVNNRIKRIFLLFYTINV
nr:MAG TPA: hypothetical protein [Caudoviricetes sp.]